MDEYPADPQHDWPKHFGADDFVRLADGRPARIIVVQDYAPEPPARWELIVSSVDLNGFLDVFIVEPWECRLDPSAATDLDDAETT